jgi:hypothetical protein
MKDNFILSKNIFLKKKKTFLEKNVGKIKAVSPLIATILLIVVAVAIIAIIISWGKGFTQEGLKDTTTITSFKISDATHFIFNPNIKGNILTFTYSPSEPLKRKEIMVNRISVLGYEGIINIDPPVTLREGITGIENIDLSSLDIQERKITIVLYTINDEIINLKNVTYTAPVCKTGLNNQEIYVLCYADDFDYVRDNLDGNYALGTNIDFFNPSHWITPPLNISTTTNNWNGGQGFIPIGNSSNKFTGSFDGLNYTISNLYISRNITGVGLFGEIGTNGLVQNIILLNINITGGHFVGGISGFVSGGSIQKSYTNGNLTLGGNLGGGITGGTGVGAILSECKSSVNISGGGHKGGIVGHNHSSSVINSYSTGIIGAETNSAGLIGGNWDGATVTNSYTTQDTLSGGGNNPAGITNSYKGTDDLTNISTFLPEWNIVNIEDWNGDIWFIDNGNDYPRLGWEFNPD